MRTTQLSDRRQPPTTRSLRGATDTANRDVSFTITHLPAPTSESESRGLGRSQPTTYNTTTHNNVRLVDAAVHAIPRVGVPQPCAREHFACALRRRRPGPERGGRGGAQVPAQLCWESRWQACSCEWRLAPLMVLGLGLQREAELARLLWLAAVPLCPCYGPVAQLLCADRRARRLVPRLARRRPSARRLRASRCPLLIGELRLPPRHAPFVYHSMRY